MTSACCMTAQSPCLFTACTFQALGLLPTPSPLPASRKQPEPASTALKYDYSGKDTKHSKCDPREDWQQVTFEYCPRKRGRRPMIEMVPGSGEYFQATVDGLSETEIHVHFPGEEQGLPQHS